jgi:hypothetical protein
VQQRLCITLGLNAADGEDSDKAGSSDAEEPPQGLRGRLFDLLASPTAAQLLAAAHLANLVAMALVFPNMSARLRTITRAVYMAATLLFGADVAARCVALGPLGYTARWAHFIEGLVTLVALVSRSVDALALRWNSESSRIATVHRVCCCRRRAGRGTA